MHVDSRDWFTVTHDMPQFAMKLRTWVTRLDEYVTRFDAGYFGPDEPSNILRRRTDRFAV